MTTNTSPSARYILGLDFGTSGLRAEVVHNGRSLAHWQVATTMPKREGTLSEQRLSDWQQAFDDLLTLIKQDQWTTKITHIIADATSSTLCLFNPQRPLAQHPAALMYDDRRAQQQAQLIAQQAPQHSAATGASSTLAKLMWLEQHQTEFDGQICHQVDWLNFQFSGQLGVTDENNALKLGYDPQTQSWPDWVKSLVKHPLPQVVAAGCFLSQLSPSTCQKWGFSPHTALHAGTTDSIAAFLASGAQFEGDAVTSLGSTLAIKQLSNQAIFSPQHGLYSHRLKNKWLVGGASNSGGSVLLHHFSLQEIKDLLPRIDITNATGENCYPLTSPGERFPIADPQWPPLLPRTKDPVIKLQALIEGLVDIERRAYQKLAELGALKLNRLYAVGGGGQNAIWMALRQRQWPKQLATAQSQHAAFGVTRLLTDLEFDQ